MHRSVLGLALLVFASSNACAYTADQLVAKNIAAKGGLAALDAIHTLRLTGTMVVNGGTVSLGYVMLVKGPSSIRYEAQLQGLTQVQAFDGRQAWQIDPFQGRKDPEKLSADDARDLGEDAEDFAGALVNYQAKGYKVDSLGTEDVEGTQAYKLRVTRPDGDITYVYLDPDYFLEIRTVTRRIEHGVPVETVTDYSDYEKVDGVYFPFYQESGPLGSSDRDKVQFNKAQANVPVSDALFEMPAGPSSAAQ